MRFSQFFIDRPIFAAVLSLLVVVIIIAASMVVLERRVRGVEVVA